jgi:hypothetical protein
VTFPVGPHAIASNHQHGRTLNRNRVPDVNAITMQGDRNLAHDRAALIRDYSPNPTRRRGSCIPSELDGLRFAGDQPQNPVMH